MASTAFKMFTIFILSVVFSSGVSHSYRGKVGGRSEITDVKTNSEVQQLGNYSVEEYNRSLRWGRWKQNDTGDAQLIFKEVVRAERQVVSGIKYYMQISAIQDGVPEMFESVVVVKPWTHSRQLLNFSPTRN